MESSQGNAPCNKTFCRRVRSLARSLDCSNWSLRSDSHRRFPLYERGPVAAEARRRSMGKKIETGWRDLNPQLPAFRAGALPLSYSSSRKKITLSLRPIENGALTWTCTRHLLLRREMCNLLHLECFQTGAGGRFCAGVSASGRPHSAN